jgi:hypothetical protein
MLKANCVCYRRDKCSQLESATREMLSIYPMTSSLSLRSAARLLHLYTKDLHQCNVPIPEPSSFPSIRGSWIPWPDLQRLAHLRVDYLRHDDIGTIQIVETRVGGGGVLFKCKNDRRFGVEINYFHNFLTLLCLLQQNQTLSFPR